MDFTSRSLTLDSRTHTNPRVMLLQDTYEMLFRSVGITLCRNSDVRFHQLDRARARARPVKLDDATTPSSAGGSRVSLIFAFASENGGVSLLAF